MRHGCDVDGWGLGPNNCRQTLLHRAIDENNEDIACFLIRRSVSKRVFQFILPIVCTCCFENLIHSKYFSIAICITYLFVPIKGEAVLNLHYNLLQIVSSQRLCLFLLCVFAYAFLKFSVIIFFIASVI